MMGEMNSIFAKRFEANKINSDLQTRRINRSGSKASSVDHILYLQRTIGNQAVQRLIRSKALQAKLMIGQPGDVYEQEADRVADEVMRMPEPGVQRQVEPEEEEEEEEEILQTKPLVNQITPLVQRQVEEEEEEEMLQAKSREDATSEVTNDLESQINAIKGGGRPVAESERAYFEPRFGADFSQVRLHTDSQAAESARAVNARAYTIGRDVAFGVGQYAPGTSEGRRLLAHELTHVIQQEKVQRKLSLRKMGDKYEQEEESAAVQTKQNVSIRNSNVIQRIGVAAGTAVATLGYTILTGAISTMQQGDLDVTWPTTEVGVVSENIPRGIRQRTINSRRVIFRYRKTNPISGIEQVNIGLRCTVQYNGAEVQATFGFTAGGTRSRLMRDSQVNIRNPVSLQTVVASPRWQRAGIPEYPVVHVPIEIRVDHPWPQSNDNWTFTLVLSGMYGFGIEGRYAIENFEHVEN
jgi:hypothetical protein